MGFEVIKNTQEEISKVCSCWGNSNVSITLSDILALLKGDLLYHFDGEYGTFVKLETDISDEQKRALIDVLKEVE